MDLIDCLSGSLELLNSLVLSAQLVFTLRILAFNGESNKKAWMTGTIMEEWLRWFDSRMKGRQVLLLMDNFSAHLAAVHRINNSEQKFKNSLIAWLPPNGTSPYQPLDQGTIYVWKTLWKKQWIQYLLENMRGKEIGSTMNILLAIRWGIKAWHDDIKHLTISNCFRKALEDRGQVGEQNIEDSAVAQAERQVVTAFVRLRDMPTIRKLMDISTFLSPLEESVEDDPAVIDERIIAQFHTVPGEYSDEEAEFVPKVSIREALKFVQGLRLFEEQKEEANQEAIKFLRTYESAIESVRIASLQQSSILNFFENYYV